MQSVCLLDFYVTVIVRVCLFLRNKESYEVIQSIRYWLFKQKLLCLVSGFFLCVLSCVCLYQFIAVLVCICYYLLLYISHIGSQGH